MCSFLSCQEFNFVLYVYRLHFVYLKLYTEKRRGVKNLPLYLLYIPLQSSRELTSYAYAYLQRISKSHFLPCCIVANQHWCNSKYKFFFPPETTFTRLLHLVRGERKTVDKILNSLSVRSGNIRKSRMGEWLIYIISYFRAPLSDPFLRNSRLSIETSPWAFSEVLTSLDEPVLGIYTRCVIDS